jgi:membrane fusion protein (multidrug efflux system)
MPEELLENKPEATPEPTRLIDAVSGAPGGGKKRAAIIIFLLIVSGLVLGASWWIMAKIDISTDDAFIDGHVFQISAREAGHVSQVYVNDNQYVRKGELLISLDQSDFKTQVQNSAAAVKQAENDIASNYAKLDSANANVSLMKSKLELAENNLKRGAELFKRGIISKQDLDTLTNDRNVGQAQLRDAIENVRKAKADIGLMVEGGNAATVAQKKAALEQAKLNLSYTEVRAPADGYITRKSVEPGNNLSPGQPLMALVSLGDIWVTANYKESQLNHVHAGEKAEFTVDAYPGRVFLGKVDSIMAGTGAAFSLLPPENATGNYVKVVQRIPVKIVIDPSSDPRHQLRVGMSVVPTIHTGQSITGVLKDVVSFN